MNELAIPGDLYLYLILSICWIVFCVAVYECVGTVRRRALRVGLTLLIATALTGATAFFILDRALLAQVQSRTAIFWRLRNGLAVQFLCVWALVGALLTAAQRKETPPVRRVLCGMIGAFFLTHFVFSVLVFFY